MHADLHAFSPAIDNEFEDEPAFPAPGWLHEDYFRAESDSPPPGEAPTPSTSYSVMAYLAVWVMASLSASACIATLSALFR